jgi:ABC-type transporter Mla maintaining outer membrane lipid asymmetry ATPase subunit MlaF
VVDTQDKLSAFKVSDRIALLYQGKIAVAGTPREIESSDLPLVRQFIAGSMTCQGLQASGAKRDARFQAPSSKFGMG